MGCACCKQKDAAKAAEAADCSPDNVEGGAFTALAPVRYSPDPTQIIPDFNKPFSAPLFPSTTNPQIRPVGNTSRRGGPCVSVCVRVRVCASASASVCVSEIDGI